MSEITIYKEQVRIALAATGKGLNPQDKEDASQNCYLALLELQGVLNSIVKNSGQTAANSYAYAVSKNAIIEMYKLKIPKEKLVSISDPRIFQEVVNHVGGGDDPLDPARSKLDEAVNNLPDPERFVIHSLYQVGRTETEIGRDLGVGQSRVSQIKKKAVEKLREELKPE